MSLIRKLLDDNDAVLAEIRREFGDEFEIVGTEANGQDAVDAVRRFEPDIAVLDITMPVMDGIGTALRIP